jgi:1,4-dihydroxy-2-naphthoyl-CoA hydrolase
VSTEFEVPPDFLPSFQRALGIKMGVGTEGEGLAWIDVDKEMHWGRTAVHGGLFPALVDVAGAIAVAQTVPDAVKSIEATIEMKINYLKRAKEGDLTATARVIHRGKRIAVCDVDITNNGVRCGKASVSYMLRTGDVPEPT